MIKIYLLILLIISFINGCSSIDYSRKSSDLSQTTAPIEERTPLESDIQQPRLITTAAVTHSPAVKKKQTSPPPSRQAVLDLLEQSKQAIQEYEYDNAEALLKRALRIEPGNAWLWHNMAVLKFYQQDYHQAIQQALKSNNLGKNSPQLRNNNSKIIKQSYIELGELENAQQY